MAQKDRLRLNRYGTVINTTSFKQELQLGDALLDATERIIEKFGLELRHDKRVMLKDIVAELRESFSYDYTAHRIDKDDTLSSYTYFIVRNGDAGMSLVFKFNRNSPRELREDFAKLATEKIYEAALESSKTYEEANAAQHDPSRFQN